MSGLKTQICRTSPPHSANLCPDIISLTYIFISPLNVPALVTEKIHTPLPHAAVAFVACRRLQCPPPHPATATSHASS